jgi:hypothetical protein
MVSERMDTLMPALTVTTVPRRSPSSVGLPAPVGRMPVMVSRLPMVVLPWQVPRTVRWWPDFAAFTAAWMVVVALPLSRSFTRHAVDGSAATGAAGTAARNRSAATSAATHLDGRMGMRSIEGPPRLVGHRHGPSRVGNGRPCPTVACLRVPLSAAASQDSTLRAAVAAQVPNGTIQGDTTSTRPLCGATTRHPEPEDPAKSKAGTTERGEPATSGRSALAD